MLVLSRKQGQEIALSGPATVQILGISGSKVSIGIEALPQTRIVRTELETEAAGNERPRKTSTGVEHLRRNESS